MEAQKTKLLISTERQKVVEKEAETEQLKATIAARKQADVSRITMERKVLEKQVRSRSIPRE
jgi:erlin